MVGSRKLAGWMLGMTAALALAAFPAAAAERTQIRIAEQYGLAYLPLHVAVERKMIENRAKAAGLGGVKVVFERFSGGAAVNQAILSGRSDIGAGGVTAMLSLWDRTRGSDNETRGIMALGAIPLKFVTGDPRVRSLKDYADLSGHRIAVPATKVSIQAVVLQMAAEKTFGEGQHRRLDDMAAAIPHPRAAEMMIGGETTKTHIATPPYSFRESASGKGRVIANSYDIVGGPHSTVVLFASKPWKDANPALFQAVADGCADAIKWINGNRRRAAESYLSLMELKHDLSEIETILGDRNQIVFDATPRNTMPFARFMHKTGAIRTLPAAWADYFWETVQGQDGG
ncbi:MAG: ABC transporter substrate-binding protein [Alphaproteobacteria bacterium]|nr:ABC transporter substrate-binding protein [Alphaproteobacteria bacterium]